MAGLATVEAEALATAMVLLLLSERAATNCVNLHWNVGIIRARRGHGRRPRRLRGGSDRAHERGTVLTTVLTGLGGRTFALVLERRLKGVHAVVE